MRPSTKPLRQRLRKASAGRLAVWMLAAPLLLASATTLAADSRAGKFYEDALQRYERKDIDGAIIQLKNALQVDKSLLPVQVLLGKALLANSQPAAAEVAFEEALRLGVDRAEVVVPLAEALIAQGKHVLLFEQTRLKPEGLAASVRFQLLLVRASAAAEMGNVRSALQAVEEARSLQPRAPETFVSEVVIRMRANQLPEALAAADKAIALSPSMAEAWYQRGAVLHVKPDLMAAMGDYDRALKLDDKHLEARLARAGILIDLARYKEARVEVEALLAQSASEPRAVYLKALLAEQAGEPAQARAALREVTGLIDPVAIEFIRYRPQLLLLNGLAHFGLDEQSKAKPYLEYFHKAQSSSPVSKLLAQIYLAEPSVDRAIDVLETYLKAQPRDGQAMVLLASAQMAQGRHAKATALMQEALRSKDAPEFRTALGLSLMRSGQNAGAVTELETAFTRDPRQTQAGTALVALYLRNTQNAKAVAVAEQLVKQQPDNASFLNLLGLSKALAGDTAGAQRAYEQTLKLAPTLTSAKIGLARIDMQTQRFDAAAARLDGILRVDERNIDALLEMAALSQRRGKLDETERWLKKAVDFSGNKEVRPGFALIDFHLRNRHPGPALEVAKQMLARAPDDVSAQVAYARAQLANGDLQGARPTLLGASRRAGYERDALVEVAGLQAMAGDLVNAAYSLDKVLSSEPGFIPALTLLTRIELSRGNIAHADKLAQQVVQAEPKRAFAHLLQADVAQAKGQAAAGLASARKAHEVEPSTNTVMKLMQAHSTLGETKASIKVADDWLRSHPKDLTVKSVLANNHARQGNFAAARTLYEQLLQLNPKDPATLNNLANVLLRMGESAALPMAERAYAADTGNPAAIDTYGWALHTAGQTDKALQMLRDARLRAPQSPDIRYHLAVVLHKAGRSSEARIELDAALKSGNAFENAIAAQKLQQTLK